MTVCRDTQLDAVAGACPTHGGDACLVEPLRVAVPLGIGDCHWACQKLAGLAAFHPNRPIHAYVNCSPNHASVGYLNLVPFVAKAVQSGEAPFDIARDLPDYKGPQWSDRAFCAGWRGFDYVCVPNGHLERGDPIRTFWPDVATAYTYPLTISDDDRADVARRFGLKRVLLYLSGQGPNEGFHRHTWTPGHWVVVMRLLNAAGIVPLLVGANTADDRSYLFDVARIANGVEFESSVGKTTIPQYCAQIESAAVWIGLNSGGGIVSAMRGTPTVMLWSDSDFPITDPENPNLPLHSNMQWSWLRSEQMATYRTFSYGSPALTPEAVVQQALAVSR